MSNTSLVSDYSESDLKSRMIAAMQEGSGDDSVSSDSDEGDDFDDKPRNKPQMRREDSEVISNPLDSDASDREVDLGDEIDDPQQIGFKNSRV